MLTSRQLEIFGIFADSLFKGITFRNIKDFAKEKSNSLLQNAIKQFKEENLIYEEKIGNVSVYSANLENMKTIDYLSIFYQEKKIEQTAKEDIEKIKEIVQNKSPFLSIVVFGSFATGKYKENSDLDIAFIVEEDKNSAKIVGNEIKKRCIKDIHLEIFNRKEFEEMLIVDYENVGKEIARKNLPIYNQTIFYSILKKGVEHGFKS